jgi:hypothetical protein
MAQRYGSHASQTRHLCMDAHATAPEVPPKGEWLSVIDKLK